MTFQFSEEYDLLSIKIPGFLRRPTSLTSACSALSSEMITFEIGPDGQKFLLHANIVTKQSPSLHALIKGNMKEARERRVVWFDTEVETFLLFAQFVYTGKYQVVEADRVDVQANGKNAVSSKKQKGKREAQYYEAGTLHYNHHILDVIYGKNGAIHCKACGSEENYWNALHQNGYDAYSLTQQQQDIVILCRTLHITADAAVFLLLIRYTYGNTTATSGVATPDPLRRALTIYAAHHAKAFWKMPEFGQLVEDVGEFARDLTGALVDLQR